MMRWPAYKANGGHVTVHIMGRVDGWVAAERGGVGGGELTGSVQ